MGYINKNLMAGEEIVRRAKLHWIIYLPAIAWAALAIALFILLAGKDSYIAVGICAVLAIYTLVKALLEVWGSDFAVTNKRLILKRGIISRSTVEMLLTKCEGVSVDQGIIGRILGYGTIITTTGGVTNRFKKIADPVGFRNTINVQIDEAQRK